MGLSGLVGSGAVRGLEEILTEQLVQAKFKEEQRRAQAMEAQNAARLAQDATQHADVMGLRGRELDQRDTDRRDRSNRAGVEDMDRQAGMMAAAEGQKAIDALLGQIPEGPKRVVTSLRSRGVNAPDLPDAAEDERKRQAGLTDYEAKKRIDLRYREPKSGGDEGFSLSEGQTRYDAKGQPIATNAKKGGGVNGSPSPYSTERADRTIAAVDALIPKANAWTTGVGSLLKNLPATDARAFDAQLKTLTSNIAFNELTQMREASKTGGALGAVSDREIDLLSSTLGAIDSGQDRQNLVQQLGLIKESVQRWKQAAALGGAGVQAEMPAAAPARRKFDANGREVK